MGKHKGMSMLAGRNRIAIEGVARRVSFSVTSSEMFGGMAMIVGR